MGTESCLPLLPDKDLRQLHRDSPEKLDAETIIINIHLTVINVPAHPTALAQPWVMIVGAILGALTLLFFMGLVLLGVAGHEVPCNSTYLVTITLSLGAALAAGFLGGNASATGAIPLFQQNPLAIGVTGGIAALIIMLAITSYLFTKKDCGAVSGPQIIYVNNGISIDGYEEGLKRQERELRAEIDRSSAAANAANIEQIDGLKKKLDEYEAERNKSVSDFKDKLEGAQKTWDGPEGNATILPTSNPNEYIVCFYNHVTGQYDNCMQMSTAEVTALRGARCNLSHPLIF